mgnify:CR=1 FL=1
MDETIQISKHELIELVSQASRSAANDAIDKTLRELGIKTDSMWITQNQAHQLIRRKRLDRAIREGKVRWRKKDLDKQFSRVYINKKDLQNLQNNPTL